MPMNIIFWTLTALVGIGVVALLTWNSIRDWLYSNRVNYDDYGVLIKEAIGSGKVRVVAGVWNRRGEKTAQSSWEAERVDSELQGKFGLSDTVRITL
jgi:hypothetical protein